MTSNNSWWKGSRGEWYVVGQLILIALVFFGPRSIDGFIDWAPGPALACSIIGGALLIAGSLLLFSGVIALGNNLTPLPHPRENGSLIERGPYRFVRHPIYSGGIFISVGWALFVHGWLTLLYALLLALFIEIKSRREEEWLLEKFPGYDSYRKRVPKLIPFSHSRFRNLLSRLLSLLTILNIHYINPL